MEFGALLILIDLMNLIHILSNPMNIQGREPTCIILSENNSRWLATGYLLTDFFRTWSDDREQFILHVDTN